MTAKQQYKQIGKVIFVFAFVTSVLQTLLSVLQTVVLKDSSGFESIIGWLVTFGPIYLIAFPLALLMFKKIPVDKAEPQKLKISTFLVYFVECIAVMYIGNIIGSFLSFILSNGQATNPVVTLTTENNFLQVLVITIIAPIIEEIFFRKKIINHTIMYGEKVSVFYSALTFALFHMNLFQFFYAFGLGLIFGYIYVKTRNIKYSMIMHVIINFFGGVIAPYLLSQMSNITFESTEILTEVELINKLTPALMFVAYAFILLILVIIGIVFLIKNRKRVSFKQTELDIPNGEVINTAYINVYYILFVIICFVIIALSLIS